MQIEDLERSFRTARDVVATVKADQLDDPTPCASWTVRDVLNHLISNALSFPFAVRGEQGPNYDDVDLTGDDMVATYDEATAQSIAAFGAPGVLEKTLQLHFGPIAAIDYLGIAAADSFAHAWDLSKATGLPTDFDPDHAQRLLEWSRTFIQPGFRGADGQLPFGPEQEAPPGASNADRLLAFLGRRV